MWVAHFVKLQRLTDDPNTTVVRMYFIAGHGKEEVDYVGGIANVKVRREVVAGRKLHFAEENFSSKIFRRKYAKKKHHYQATWGSSKRKAAKDIHGSYKFQAIVFRPHQRIKASSWIYLCEEWNTKWNTVPFSYLKSMTFQSIICNRSAYVLLWRRKFWLKKGQKCHTIFWLWSAKLAQNWIFQEK